MSIVRIICAASLFAVTLAGCQPEPRLPDLSTIYDVAARTDSPERRPVITIPGTLGSRLLHEDSDTIIWGGKRGLSIDPATPANEALLALPYGTGAQTLRELRDGVRTAGVLRVARPSVLGLELRQDVYSGVVDTLIAGGYDFRRTRQEEIDDREINLDSFEFPYDWRRDIVEAAHDLDYFIKRKTRQVADVRAEVFGADTKPVKFDIIAHSMGALVARYYLMYGAAELPADGSLPEVTWAGARNVSRVIYIAPPNAGSVKSFEALINGKTFGLFQPEFTPGLLGTHVSTYQLLPRPRHQTVTIAGEAGFADIFDVEEWDRRNWGVLAPSEAPVLARLMPDLDDPAARRARAKAHLALILRRARQFQRAMDRPAVPPPGLDAFLIIGGGVDTASEVAFDPATGKVTETDWSEGDGVVTRASSLLDERQGSDFSLALASPLTFRSILLLPDEHLQITASPVFGDNVLFWLLEYPRGAYVAPRDDS